MSLINRKITLLALAIAAVAGAPMSPAVAELPKARTAAKQTAFPAAKPAVRRARSYKAMPLVTFKYVLTYIPIAADMSGWSVVTNGPAKGGGSLIKADGKLFLAARGADDDIYVAPFDPANLVPQPESAWRSFGVQSTSEPNCNAAHNVPGSDSGWGLCAFLGQSGNALFASFQAAATGVWKIDTVDMGGSKAGAAPTVVDRVEWVNDKVDGTQEVTAHFAVWDGKSGLFFKRDGWKLGPDYLDPAAGATSWQKLPSAFFGPIGCSPYAFGGGVCASVDNERIRIGSLDIDGKYTESAVSPALAGLTGRPALVYLGSDKYIVVARGKGGKVHKISYVKDPDKFGPAWKDEGGFITQGSSPTCASVATQAVCVVQGGDGKLYAKAISAGSGL